MDFKHISVFLEEAVDALNIRPGGTYVDCTGGGGGHSGLIAQRLNGDGALYSIDRDPQAITVLQERLGQYPNVTVVHGNFFDNKNIFANYGIRPDGILADLGVSSHQLDCAERGFSFHQDAPLDMRMSMTGETAAQLVNTASQQALQKILFTYGEEKFAPSIARAIVRERAVKPIETTLELAEIIKSAVPAAARRDGHPARRSFQAIRIAVNGELDQLGQAVSDLFDGLAPGGRLAIITFHSLEDRTVKNVFADLCKGCECPKEFPMCVCGKTPRGKLPFKALAPSKEQLDYNSRSRSARLRVIEKIK